MLRLFRFLKPYRKQLSYVMALLLVQSVTNLYLPELNADIINQGIAKGDTNYILATGGWMLLVTLVLGVCSIAAVYGAAQVAMAVGRDLRSAIFRKVAAFSQTELNRFGTPSLITRNTNDVQQIQTVVLLVLTVMVVAPFMMVGGVIMAMRQDVPLSGLIAVILPVMGLFLFMMLRRAMPLFKRMQVNVDTVNQVTREKLAGMRVIRAFVRTAFEARRFESANADLTATALSVNRLFALMMPVMMLMFNISAVAIMWFGGLRVESGAMPIGNLTAFLTYIMQILMSVMMASIMFVMVPRAAASAERINAVLDVEPSIREKDGSVTAAWPVAASATRPAGLVQFEDVEFRYPGAEDAVLCGVTFTARPGQTTAIVGSTGSGKTTLINLIPRFYDVTGGRVLVDGADIREVGQEALWSRIGFVPQKAFLFSGTIASNLRYGKADATDDELWHALQVAPGKAFVSAMPERLEAPVTQGGASVSGGQRQRLAIARALVKRPEIYIFDDSFSALDFKTDSMLRAALHAEVTEATVIIVAQRVSTIMHADQIVVMHDGTVAGIGTHDELMRSCDTYVEIVESQLTEEEIA